MRQKMTIMLGFLALRYTRKPLCRKWSAGVFFFCLSKTGVRLSRVKIVELPGEAADSLYITN